MVYRTYGSTEDLQQVGSGFAYFYQQGFYKTDGTYQSINGKENPFWYRSYENTNIREIFLSQDKNLYINGSMYITDIEGIYGGDFYFQRTDGKVYFFNRAVLFDYPPENLPLFSITQIWGGGAPLMFYGDYAKGVPLNSTAAWLERYTDRTYAVADKNGDPLPEGAYIGTGCRLTVNGEPYTALLTGDTDGNGVITGNDYIIAMKLFLQDPTALELDECYKLAADADNNGEITGNDYIVIMKQFLENN